MALRRKKRSEPRQSPNGDDAPTVGLDRVLKALSNDLNRALAVPNSQKVGLGVQSVEIELAFTVGSSGEGGADVNLKVLGVGVGGGGSRSHSSETVHRVHLSLVPVKRAISGNGNPDSAAASEDSSLLLADTIDLSTLSVALLGNFGSHRSGWGRSTGVDWNVQPSSPSASVQATPVEDGQETS
jgi:hypothetical protein